MQAEQKPYVPIIHRNLARMLALFNEDSTDPLYGCGDRRYWAWKLIDYPNGTYQGASYGLSLLLVNGLLPKGIDEEAMQRRIEGIISVVPRLTDHQGSLSEALPNEGSFCVTGLVLADCLGALTVLAPRIEPKRREALVQGLAPLASFLMRQDETHGIISNHLATTALAMARWATITGDTTASQRAAIWIDRIRSHAHSEGWMREYDGADPGYQSWCTSALAQIATEAPGFEVDELVQKSFGFLEAFAFPDGRFAQGCGSRMTRFFMPGGAELYSDRSDAAARLSVFARLHAGDNRFVSLDAIDEPNLVPFFNDLVIAAVNAGALNGFGPPEAETRHFPAAGLCVHVGGSGKLVINTRRGGWMTQSNDTRTADFPEPVARQSDGVILRPVRGQVIEQSDANILVHAELEPVRRMLPSPGKFIVLRILSMTVFRSARLGNRVKNFLARLLLSESGKSSSRVERRIDLENATVTDRILEGDAVLIENPRGFSPIHMASKGYWQVSDDTTSES